MRLAVHLIISICNPLGDIFFAEEGKAFDEGRHYDTIILCVHREKSQ
jgi:hypothetical protein